MSMKQMLQHNINTVTRYKLVVAPPYLAYYVVSYRSTAAIWLVGFL